MHRCHVFTPLLQKNVHDTFLIELCINKFQGTHAYIVTRNSIALAVDDIRHLTLHLASL